MNSSRGKSIRRRFAVRASAKAAGWAILIQVLAVTSVFAFAPRELAIGCVMYFYLPAAMVIKATGTGELAPLMVMVIIVVPALGILLYSVMVGLLVGLQRAKSGEFSRSESNAATERLGAMSAGLSSRIENPANADDNPYRSPESEEN